MIDNFSQKNVEKIGWLAVLIFLDQFSKYLIRHGDGFYICNSGVAFGIRISPILWLLAVFFLGFYGWLVIGRNNFFHSKQIKVALILIVAGAISNAIDRLMWGCVVDFISVNSFKFPLFNFADIFISGGAILIFWYLYGRYK